MTEPRPPVYTLVAWNHGLARREIHPQFFTTRAGAEAFLAQLAVSNQERGIDIDFEIRETTG